MGKVYMITSPSGRIYIGSTITKINDRWRCYKLVTCKDQVKLYNSLKKYGPENHIFEVIWEGKKEDMLKYEAMIGLWYEVIDKGLNLALPKISDKYKNIHNTIRLKMRNAKLGKARSLETKEKIRLESLKRKHKPQAIEKLRCRKISEETRQKMKLSAKNRIGTYHGIKVKVLCTLTGKVFNSITEAAKFMGVDASFISRKLRGKQPNNTTLIYKDKNE